MQSTHQLWQAALIVGFCVLTTSASAQSQRHEHQGVEQEGSGSMAQEQTETDEALTQRIRQALQENAPLSGAAQKIRIDVAQGEVLLRGEVQTAAERDGIAAQVRQMQGVRTVKNRLRVAGAEREAVPRTDEGADGLRATFAEFVRAENAHDLDTLLSLAHDWVVFVGPIDAFPVAGKAAYRQVWQRWFEHERFVVDVTNDQIRAVGSIGVAWGLYTLTLKPKDGPLVTSSGRYTLTFSRTEEDGKWLLVAFHASRLP